MVSNVSELRYEDTGHWFDEFVGIATNPGTDAEPHIKRTGTPLYAILWYLDRAKMDPKDVGELYGATEEEVRAADAYWKTFPWLVDMKISDDVDEGER